MPGIPPNTSKKFNDQGMQSIKITFIILVGFLSLGAQCNKSEVEGERCMKGKLLINGICGNITIQWLSGDIDKSLIERTWVDPVTNIKHENVFALKNVCSFPKDILEGEAFYFILDANEDLQEPCIQCKALRPKPEKSLMIRVCQ